LINCARHALATHAEAAIGIAGDCVNITISDNGRGFPFQGRYDLTELATLHLGPKSLMERISALQGRLIINSSTNGSALEMSIPFKTANSFGERA
jgi:signal transduction histidine kinase